MRACCGEGEGEGLEEEGEEVGGCEGVVGGCCGTVFLLEIVFLDGEMKRLTRRTASSSCRTGPLVGRRIPLLGPCGDL